MNVLAVILVLGAGLVMHSKFAGATGGCTPPATDYGQVSFSSTTSNAVSITSPGTYYLWSRMAAQDTTNNTYMVDIDGSSCYSVGGSSAVPVYAAGDPTDFTGANTSAFSNQTGQNNSNWINTGCSGAQTSCGSPVRIAVNITSAELSANGNTVKITMYGNAPGVVVDRLIFTQEPNCVPDNTATNNYGDNCAIVDTNPPTINISTVNGTDVSTSPNPGPSVPSPATVVAAAADDVAIAKVELYLDGATTPTQTDTTPAYSFAGLALSPGPHTVLAKAYDTSGNTTSSSVAYFTVADTTAPTVSISAPANGSTQSGTVTVTATASDNVGVAKTELYVDGTLNSTQRVVPYNFTLDTTTLSNASHSLTVKAYDAAGNVTTSATVSITVNNTAGTTDTTPPVINITSPTADQIIADRAFLFAPSLVDASGIKQVVFQVDGNTVATDTTAPFSYTLDTSTFSATGYHTLSVKATDNSAAQNTNPTFMTVRIRVTTFTDVDRNCRINNSDLSGILVRRGALGANLGPEDVDNNGRINNSDMSPVLAARGNLPC